MLSMQRLCQRSERNRMREGWMPVRLNRRERGFPGYLFIGALGLAMLTCQSQASAQSIPTDFEELLPKPNVPLQRGKRVERIDPDSAFMVSVYGILPKRRLKREFVHAISEQKKYSSDLPDRDGEKLKFTFAADDSWTIANTSLKIRSASGMYRFRSRPSKDRSAVNVDLILRTGTALEPTDAWIDADIVITEEREVPPHRVLQDTIDVLVGGTFALDGEPLAEETMVFLFDRWNEPLGLGPVDRPFYIGRLELKATVANTPSGPTLTIEER